MIVDTLGDLLESALEPLPERLSNEIGEQLVEDLNLRRCRIGRGAVPSS